MLKRQSQPSVFYANLINIKLAAYSLYKQALYIIKITTSYYQGRSITAKLALQVIKSLKDFSAYLRPRLARNRVFYTLMLEKSSLTISLTLKLPLRAFNQILLHQTYLPRIVLLSALALFLLRLCVICSQELGFLITYRYTLFKRLLLLLISC